MSARAAVVVRRNVVRAALTAWVGIWLSGCSADSSRFSDSFGSPFGNPFATASNEAGAPPTASAAPKADYAATAHPSPVAVAALSPAAPAAPAATSQIKPSSNQPVAGFVGKWSVVGGSPIVVADGDTLDGVSRRYGVPATAILKSNGLSSASQVAHSIGIASTS